jgi:integrase
MRAVSKFADQPRSKFAEPDEPVLADFPEGNLAWLIQKRIDESKQPGARPVLEGQLCNYRLLQRSVLCQKHYNKAGVIDYVQYGRSRIAGGVKPQTVMHDMSSLGGVLRYAWEMWEMPKTAYDTLIRAKKQMEREQLIAESIPRDRLPQDDEIAIMRAHEEENNKRPRNKIDMVLVIDAELVTGRRISELCRIERQHVNVAKRTCWLYDLKDARGKGYNAEFALIEGAWELFEKRLAVIPNEPKARLFPFRSRSCSARYTVAKHDLRKKHPTLFHDLHMHDNRSKCFMVLLDKGYSEAQIQKGVSLHKGSGRTLRDSYIRIKAADLHKGPASRPIEPETPR